MNLCSVPWRLIPNKFYRDYRGGREIDAFRGTPYHCDDGKPEAWIGSDTRLCDVTERNPNDGCQRCLLPDGREMYLFEAISLYPEEMLGQEHLKKNGKQTAILVKLLDAQEQLALQSHPDREFAKKYFQSDKGKAECWYVIGMRKDASVKPYVYMGFKEGVTREVFEKYYMEENLPAMENCCHKVEVKVGDCFDIAAGVPHAIGEGCFMIEVQEPSDLVVFTNRAKTGTKEEQDFHNERELGCYHYDGYSYEENLKHRLVPPVILREGNWGTEKIVLGTKQTPFFSCTRMDAVGNINLTKTGFPQTCICTEGAGVLEYQGGKMELRRGDEFFLPASIGTITLVPGQEGIGIVFCHPEGYICAP